jgi:hypothetical protein
LEAFIFELGSRANKVEIHCKEDNSIEVKPKGWLGKKNWTEINDILLRNGFEWFSSGKDSLRDRPTVYLYLLRKLNMNSSRSHFR